MAEVQKRGRLTERIKDKSKELLGYEISGDELLLMGHLQYTLTNSQQINPEQINGEERKILSKWHRKEYIERYSTNRPRHMINVAITKKFWDIICELIYLGYVDTEQED